MYGKIKEHLEHELAEIKAAGLYKNERIIESPQRAEITVGGRQVLNFCANNYLGLSDNPRLIEAAKKAMDTRGYGMSSVRFICGCQDMHKQLEKAIADYFGTEDTILYAACFDANGGVFEPLFTEQDAIISDSLNHASIIDGVRLCKAVRYRYANADMAELEDCLKKAQAQRFRIIVTDGVFSMDGNAAPLDEICKLAEKYDMPILYSCHPRSRNRLASSGFKLDPRVIQHEPLGFHDYNCLQMNAFAVVSDSGTLPEESSFFTSVGHPFPAICIRTSTERPESLDKAGFILSGIDTNGLLQSVETAVELVKNGDYGTPVPDYTDENVSTKVVKIIQSYVGVVNKMVWRKF